VETVAKLLLTEDDAETVDAVLGDLTRRGHGLVWANTGLEGAARAQTEPFDALILDRRRLAATQIALDRVMQGDLRQRLPIGERGDEFNRLAGNVNRMLDEIERRLGEVSSIGDAIAHDLRTPLTRLRARLERTRDGAISVAEFCDAIDQGLAWIDQTLTMVTAVLRIGEIEHKRRFAGFAPVELP
jgi:signal transduction histidine kinase